MKIVLADIEKEALIKAEGDIKALGADTLAVKTDVSKADNVKALAEKAIDAFGAVHLLCNNAGVSSIGLSLWENTLADWQWVLGVNLWGVIHGVHFFVPIMLKQDNECYIVNTASAAGLLTGPGSSPYYITKHGVVALSEILYRELEQGGYNIGVSVLCPGFIKTNIVDSERNRPKELRNDLAKTNVKMADPLVQARIQFAKQQSENGMLPRQVADIVFSAIREKKFYILPNAETTKPLIQTRMEDILQQRNPTTLPIELK
jgi:NAD(P)-dependent dehydrogenase (short-subunit alcohol dehydrogenase family)